MQNNIRTAQNNNDNLNNVSKFETQLRKNRDGMENTILNVASEAQDTSFDWTNANLVKVQQEDERI